jgi:hypothetical protein
MKLIKLFVFLSLLLLNAICFGKSQQSIADSPGLIEKVYLQTDRNTYFRGEDVWFKAYLTDAFDHLLTDHSHNLHVELISPALKIISNRIIRLDGGLGNGDFSLPKYINSGRYKIRAYTNYMRNFSDQLFFTKEITIVNPDDGQGEISENVKYVENKIRLYFFPEGGSLVNYVSSIVAFKAVDNLGKGCNVSGKIYSSNGDLITVFRSTHLGMGTFFLRPLPGLKYFAIVKGADSTDIKAELPASFSTGVTISASKNQDNEMLITTKTNSETLALISEHDLLLSISIRNEVLNTFSLRIKSPVTSFVVPTGYLPEGILMLTLTTLGDLPLSERLVYREGEAPIKINIKTDKNLYKKREPVTIKISLSDDSTIEEEGNISLAVVDETCTNSASQYPRTISSWFLLESDIRGIVEEPSYYFDQSDPDRLKNMDLLLLSQGWRDFAWKYDTIYFPPEDGFTISGRFLKNNKKKPVEDSRVSIGIFGSRSTLLKSVPVDSTGRFKLSGIDLAGKATLIATGIGKNDHPVGVLTLDSVAYDPEKVSDSLFMPSILVEKNRNKLISYYKINEALKKKYKLSDTIGLGGVNIISELRKDPQTIKIESSRSKYVKPEAELIVTEQMLGYNNMLHLLNGKIPGLVVLGDTSIIIRGIGSLSANLKPLILIDGNQATFDDLIQMPIFIVDRIDVLKSSSATNIYGFLGFNGVINLITKAGGVSGIYSSPDYSAKLRISGYNVPRFFYSPVHLPDSTTDPEPDLRNTILWNPDINLYGSQEITLNFYNGDNTSLIRIIAEGMTKTGIPVTGKAQYEVR